MNFERIVYAGHSAVFVETASCRIAIDPWLQHNPLCPENLKDPGNIDLIALTHGHADHASDTPRLAKMTGARVAATWELSQIMREEGVAPEQLMPMNKGGSIEYKGVKVSFTHAQHSSSYDTSKGPVYAGEACGVVLSAGRYSIYHAGDTAMFSDMELIGELYRPYIALLPIGDCFTMGPAHAARAAKFIGCRIAIPIHHKTFDALTGTAEMFRKECSRFDIEVVELLPGEALSISPQTAARAA